MPDLNDGLIMVTPTIRRLAGPMVCLTPPREPTYVDDTSNCRFTSREWALGLPQLPLPTTTTFLINSIVFYADVCFEISNKTVPGR